MNVVLSNWRGTVSLIFFMALLTRVAFILTQQDGFYFPDSLLDSQAAVKLLSVGQFDANFGRAPGYPVFLAAVYLLFGESILAVRVVESFMGAFLAVIMAGIGRRAGGEIVGALAGTIWAVYPLGIFIAGLVYPTGLTTMLLACGVGCVLPATHEELSAKGMFLGGLFLGLAALTIPVALLTIVVVAAWVFYWARHSRLFLASLLLFGSAVSLAPWTVRNFLVHGRVVSVQANFERYVPKIVAPETNLRDDRLNAIVRRSELYAGHFGRSFVQFWELYPSRIRMSHQGYRDKLHAKDSRVIKETVYSPNRFINTVSILSTGPVFFFAFLGTAAMCVKRHMRRELAMLWLMVFSFAVGYAFFWGKMRYRIPVEPYLIILSAYGIHATYAMISARLKLAVDSNGSVTSRRST